MTDQVPGRTNTQQKTLDNIRTFLTESNSIEGIYREVTDDEVQEAKRFYFLEQGRLFSGLLHLQETIAPGKPIRDLPGMDVRVGYYSPPPGGPEIRRLLKGVLAGIDFIDPYAMHLEFEGLHPFMDGNGRTGRMLWAWHMKKMGQDPFALSFLHRFYYQTLSARGPVSA